MKHLFVLLALQLSFVQAQNLPRKASLGAQTELTQNGLLVKEVLSGTAVLLKLQQGDLLVSINGSAVHDMASLKLVMSDKVDGDAAKFVVERKKKKITLTGVFVGKPMETSSYSDVIYDQAPFRGGQLRVIINKPKKEEKMPALLFIPGYTCSSIDNLSDNHPYKRIIDVFGKAGFVTLRIEKSGLGDSRNTPSCESCDLHDEIENFQVGLDKLKGLPYVDTNKIIIFGHSMGGVVAPALSAKNQVAGVIVFGTIAKSWFEYQLEMIRIQNLLAEMEPLEHEQSVKDHYEFSYRFFIKNEPLIEMAKDSALHQKMIELFQYDAKTGMIYDRYAEYWRQIQSLDHLENWKNTKAKVLVQFGESDFQAFSLADHEQIVRTVNFYNPNSAELITFPLTDHIFARAGTMQEAYDKFVQRKYSQLFDEYNIEVGNSAVEWSLKVIGI